MGGPQAVLAILIAVLVGATAAVAVWVNSEFTECYALFGSGSDAQAAARDVRETAPGTDLDVERRGRGVAATYANGETGADAAAFRRAFRPAVADHGGRLGHPGDGCLERGPFM